MRVFNMWVAFMPADLRRKAVRDDERERESIRAASFKDAWTRVTRLVDRVPKLEERLVCFDLAGVR